MPHVIVKLWPGKSEAQKARLAEKITRDVMEGLVTQRHCTPVRLPLSDPADRAAAGLNGERTNLQLA